MKILVIHHVHQSKMERGKKRNAIETGFGPLIDRGSSQINGHLHFESSNRTDVKSLLSNVLHCILTGVQVIAPW